MKLSSLYDRLAPHSSCLGIDVAWAGEFISVSFFLTSICSVTLMFCIWSWLLWDSGALTVTRRWSRMPIRERWFCPCVLSQTLHCYWDSSDVSHKNSCADYPKGPVHSPVAHPPGCLFSAKKSIWRTSWNRSHTVLFNSLPKIFLPWICLVAIWIWVNVNLPHAW